MRNDNYYQVQGWMLNELHLKGNELICYAVIYSFSQDGESKYMGGLKYLCGWMNASEPTVVSILEKLTNKGLIEPIETKTDTCRRVYYKVTKDSLVGDLRNLSKVTKDSLVNNNNITIKEKIKEKRLSNDNPKSGGSSKRFVKPTVEQIEAYIREKNLHFDAEAFFDYYESKGWMVGSNHMKDWKAACRTWEHKRKSQEKREEPTEEIVYPEGISKERWKEIVYWLLSNVPRIAGDISVFDFDKMKRIAGDSIMLSDGLRDLNKYIELNGKVDIMEKFKEIIDAYKNG